tara:strand:+ start:677 stop:883 length:207 start_codon:yes stop_codon:yes gene_type:complete
MAGHIYHRGYLSRDCHDLAGPDTKKLLALGKITPAIADLRHLRKKVWDAAERGEGYLFAPENPRRNHR